MKHEFKGVAAASPCTGVAINIHFELILFYFIYCLYLPIAFYGLYFQLYLSKIQVILFHRCGVFDLHSTIPGLEMPSGTAASMGWSTTCCV